METYFDKLSAITAQKVAPIAWRGLVAAVAAAIVVAASWSLEPRSLVTVTIECKPGSTAPACIKHREETAFVTPEQIAGPMDIPALGFGAGDGAVMRFESSDEPSRLAGASWDDLPAWAGLWAVFWLALVVMYRRPESHDLEPMSGPRPPLVVGRE